MTEKIPTSRIRRLKPPTTARSRIRLSQGDIQGLGWDSEDASFSCYGFFRREGELLCAPTTLRTPSNEHPFADVLVYRDMEVEPPETIADIPPGRIIVAASRIIEFETARTESKQIDLKLGVNNTDRLGWSSEQSQPIYIATWSNILVLFSTERYKIIVEEDLVG